jgi:hypothetical protein
MNTLIVIMNVLVISRRYNTIGLRSIVSQSKW